ncbi:MAG TPA: methyltransferase domain-containing protein [Candidatus Binatia bacterium]|nr:methyltransferase domain-containing protein [Candidatus Binatia bacterium]
MKRIVVEELLDSDDGTPAEVAGSLQDLRMFNSWFGGVHTMSSLLRRVAKERGLKHISWVDVAGGEGYVATRTQRVLARSGISSQPVIVDRAPTHLGNTHPAVCGDALALPFRDNSFDAVGCSLFLHHLEPAEIVRFVREGLRVARHAFLVQDLQRHPMHLVLSYLGMPLYRSRITRHDAVASVRRAYTVDEVRRMLAPVASAENIEIRKFFLFRMGVIVWKQPSMI